MGKADFGPGYAGSAYPFRAKHEKEGMGRRRRARVLLQGFTLLIIGKNRNLTPIYVMKFNGI